MSEQQQIACPPWEYNNTPNKDAILFAGMRAAHLSFARSSPAEKLVTIKDTRSVHARYFENLAPHEAPYYAGHYRGENYLCLREYEASIPANPKVGHPASLVVSRMAAFAAALDDAVNNLEISQAAPNVVFSQKEKLARLVSVTCAAFAYFLEVHPYANGNGHLGRFILVALLARFDIRLQSFPIHPRPKDPPYSEAVKQYQLGNRDMLEAFVLNCI